MRNQKKDLHNGNSISYLILPNEYVRDYINSYYVRMNPKLSFELILLIITTFMIFSQFFYLYQFSFQDYNIKLIVYSFAILAKRVSYRAKKHLLLIDPLDNKYHFAFFFKTLHIAVVCVPLALVCFLYETFTTVKIITLLYYVIFTLVVWGILGESKGDSLSIKAQMSRAFQKNTAIVFETLYFIFLLPLSSVTKSDLYNMLKTSTIFTIFSCLNLYIFLTFFTYTSKAEQWNNMVKLIGYWIEVRNVEQNQQQVKGISGRKHKEIQSWSSQKAVLQSESFQDGYVYGDLVQKDDIIYQFLGRKLRQTMSTSDKLYLGLISKQNWYSTGLNAQISLYFLFQLFILQYVLKGYSMILMIIQVLFIYASMQLMYYAHQAVMKKR